MNTAKQGVQLIAETCRLRGIRKVVFSPGSRSAPLVIAFSNYSEIECLVIPDERVAGYFALGMAQQLRETVAVVCTSGTAAINLLPACCEAYYQEIPLLFLTADRPVGAVNNGENQAIYQEALFQNFASDYEVDADEDEPGAIVRITERALFETQHRKRPSRLNIHLKEPLYEMVSAPEPVIPENIFRPEAEGNTIEFRIESQAKLAAELSESSKKMIVIGLRHYHEQFAGQLRELAQRPDVVVLAESLANCAVEGVIGDFDSCIAALSPSEMKDFVPDIVITLGNQIISKRIRDFLRSNQPRYHWDIPVNGETRGRNYFHLPGEHFPFIREEEALECLKEMLPVANATYNVRWHQLADRVEQLKIKYLRHAPFSDFKVMEQIVRSLPQPCQVQYGNSTPVRYSNFFHHDVSVTVNANRGASGIDGCVSTAAGAAYVNQHLTVCIVGDVSFLYDSNALWNNYLSPNLRIVVINNAGGNIFRLINGPIQVNNFETFFETTHGLTAQHLASMYGLRYYFCDRPEQLDKALATFYQPQEGRPAILEIKTNNESSATVFKRYFESLKPI